MVAMSLFPSFASLLFISGTFKSVKSEVFTFKNRCLDFTCEQQPKHLMWNLIMKLDNESCIHMIYAVEECFVTF